ncbi:MAG: hypothetical protein HOY78_25980 [Saccharothrix sp.]|nr:hypothetical protein [Saccharothrix sp.]
MRASDDPEVSRRLLGSGTAAVRAEAVRALAAAGEIAPATEALTDRSPLVRATAQTALRRAATDPATRYRTLLTQQPPQPSAVAGLGAQPPEPIADLAAQPPRPSVLAGLGETGTRRDADLLRPWLAHPSSRGRAETVRALRRLGDIPSQLLLPLLTDPVSSVTRQVVLSLIRQPLDEHFLRQLLRDPHPPHVQWAAYRLLRAQGDWTRVSVDLELIGAPDHAAHLAARVDLATWLGHDAATTYSSPKGPRATELATLVTAAEPTLGPHMTRLLRFHLGLS